MNTPRGLTLLELLAATLILAATATAGTAVLSRSRAAAQDAALTRQAVDVLAHYQREIAENADDPAPDEWTHVDTHGAQWRVRVSREPLRGSSTLDPRLPALGWEVWSVEVASDRGAYESVMTRRALVPVPARSGEEQP